jgi:hypothetical protein
VVRRTGSGGVEVAATVDRGPTSTASTRMAWSMAPSLRMLRATARSPRHGRISLTKVPAARLPLRSYRRRAAMRSSFLPGSVRAKATAPPIIPPWIVNRLTHLNLNSGPIAKYFEHLANENTTRSRAILVKADQFADAMDLEDELIDGLVLEKGRSGKRTAATSPGRLILAARAVQGRVRSSNERRSQTPPISSTCRTCSSWQ